MFCGPQGSGKTVALRKESVDRNSSQEAAKAAATMSLSARRAWIEIIWPLCLAETNQSLSARRAWIEITRFCPQASGMMVALRKESVDRNPV